MNQKWMKRSISLALAMGLVLSPGMAYGNKLEELNTKKSQTQEEIQNKESNITGIETEKNKILDEIAALDVEMAQVGQEIGKAQDELKVLEASIAETQKEVEVLRGDIAEREDQFKQRIQSMYINSKSSALESILSTDNIDNMLSKATMMSHISSFDTDVINELKHDKVTLDVKEAELQGEKAAVEIAKNNLEEKNAQLENAALAKQDKMAVLESNLLTTQEEVQALQAEAEKIDGEIEAEKKAIAEAKAQAAREALARKQAQEKAAREKTAQEKVASEGSKSSSPATPKEPASVAPTSMGSGSLGWPVPSSHNLTSYYGYRAYPFGGVDFHMGVDIAAPQGAAIAASSTGFVTYAGPRGSYGNLVILRHLDGKETYYAHCSGFAVQAGAQVTKGQTIAYIGSTGNSTGPHLHYEVRVGGAHTNPLNYIN